MGNDLTQTGHFQNLLLLPLLFDLSPPCCHLTTAGGMERQNVEGIESLTDRTPTELATASVVP